MISQGLDLSLKQELKINAQLLQTMETISLSTEELREKIRREAESNPALLVHDPSTSYDAIASEYRRATDRRESYSDDQPFSKDGGEESNWMEGMIASGETLQQHLLSELGLMVLDDGVRRTAETLITSLDRNGFFPSDPETLVRESDRRFVPQAVEAIQGMEPEGVGARDWRESLVIQAKAKGMKGRELLLFRTLVNEELENLRSGKTDQAAKDLCTDRQEVEALYAFLKTLTPFPGRRYGYEYEAYIIPELSIKKEDGHLVMRLNRNALPIVEIDPEYRDLAGEYRKDGSKEAKAAEKFIKERISSASSLISQLEIRADTLERTGAVLMDRQRDFFLYGPLHLKGLTMQEVASEIGVHEATVSRIAASKYIDTDWGIYPIRSFFSSKVESSDGANYSKNAVKEMVRKIIMENATGKPLSDQKISDILAERGIKAARRTVSKYRHELDIDSSFSRDH